jgi:uncharacterized protein YggT (Ycf19 family)
MSLALTRGDIATYVEALILVYTILILVNIILGWIQLYRPLPYNLTLRSVIGFVEDTTNPYLALFRFVPRLGPLDLSPILAILVLNIVGGIIAGAIRG